MVRARLCVRSFFLAAEIILRQHYELNPCFLALRRNISFVALRRNITIEIGAPKSLTSISCSSSPQIISLESFFRISHFSP